MFVPAIIYTFYNIYPKMSAIGTGKEIKNKSKINSFGSLRDMILDGRNM